MQTKRSVSFRNTQTGKTCGEFMVRMFVQETETSDDVEPKNLRPRKAALTVGQESLPRLNLLSLGEEIWLVSPKKQIS